MYSEKAIERLIENLSNRIHSSDIDCYICPVAEKCILNQEITENKCKAEIKRVLIEWSDEE